MLQEQSNIFDRISFVDCNCPFDLSSLSGCWTCFPSEAAAYVKSPPKHMFPFPTIISIENNSFVSNSRPSAQSGLKIKTSCKICKNVIASAARSGDLARTSGNQNIFRKLRICSEKPITKLLFLTIQTRCRSST